MNVNSISGSELSFKDYNYLKEMLEEQIKKNNSCKAMAYKINTQELVNFWKEKIDKDLVLLQKLNGVLYHISQNVIEE